MIIETIKLNELGVFPELFFGICIIYLFLYGTFTCYNSRFNFPIIQTSMSYLAILVLIMVSFLLVNDGLNELNYISFNSSIACDYLSFASKLIISLSAIIFLLMVQEHILDQKINHFEYILIFLFALLGIFLLCSSNDLIIAYLSIELQSLAFYILAAFKKNSTYSIEAGLKYFVLGAFSSGLFLFGSSLIYGISGSLNFADFKDLFFWGIPGSTVIAFQLQDLAINTDLYNELGKYIIEPDDYQTKKYFYEYEAFDTSLLKFALTFILISLFFKLAIAPFHSWSPAVYEGSPSSTTFFFVVVPKLAIFVLLLRIFYFGFFGFIDSWRYYVIIGAVSSVIVGCVAGLEQRKLKSLLAYSSISHMGYLLISFSTGSFEGIQMLLNYLIIYMISGLCVWSIFVLTRLKNNYSKKQNKDLGDFVLLHKSNNMLALILTISLFSIAGLPPTIGFLVKMSIFLSAIESSMYFAALISILFSVISAFYYIRIIKILYYEPALVGKLYYPITTQKAFITTLLFYSFFFFFINPTALYLMSYKISLIF